MEPKLEILLAKKVKTNALKTKPTKKDQHYKFKSESSSTRRHFSKKESHARDYSVDSGSTLAKFAEQNFGVELSNYEEEMSDSDFDDRKPSGKGNMKPSGKGIMKKRGNCKPAFEPFYDCYSMDDAPMHIFENQVIPVRIHNIAKSFKPNLDTIRVLSLGTKFIPKWEKTKTSHTFHGLMSSKIN